MNKDTYLMIAVMGLFAGAFLSSFINIYLLSGYYSILIIFILISTKKREETKPL